MKRILRHVGGKDFRKTHQNKLDEQRALYLERREKEIQEKNKKKKIEEAAKPFKSNWKKELSEAMSTAALLSTTLAPTGDEVISQVDGYQTIFAGNGGSLSGADLSYSVREMGTVTYISGATNTYYRSATTNPIDTTRITQVKFSVSKTAQPLGANSWTDSGNSETYDDNISISMYSPNLPADDTTVFTSDATTGNYTFDIPEVLRGRTDVLIAFTQYALAALEGEPTSGTAAATLYAPTFQRTYPVSVFVGLDDPEATNFVRTDPVMRGLSAQERRKKLEDMLDAGDEYLLKQVGLQGSKARPADTGNVKSWDQASLPGTSPNSNRPSGAARDYYNMTWDKHMNMWVPNIKPPIKKASAVPADTEVAQAPSVADSKPTRLQTTPIAPVWSPGAPMIPGDSFPRPYWGPSPAGPRFKLAKKSKQPMVASYEPQGQVISEKKLKSPKEILK